MLTLVLLHQAKIETYKILKQHQKKKKKKKNSVHENVPNLDITMLR